MLRVDTYDPLSIPRWINDDNMMSQQRGWIILAPPTGGPHDIVSTSPHLVSPHAIFNDQITRFVETDPLCAKAYAFMLGQRMMHPKHVFAHTQNDPHRTAGFIHRRAIQSLEDARTRILNSGAPVPDGVEAPQDQGKCL